MAVENVNYSGGLINYSCSLLIYSRKDTFPLNSSLFMNRFPAVIGIFFLFFIFFLTVQFKKKNQPMSDSTLQCSCIHMETRNAVMCV